VLERLSSLDAKLADQLRRAAQSALGSAAEVASCLDVAVAFRYVGEPDHAEAHALVDRVRAMTYRLANR
jgi:hypothetical protein